MPKRVIAHWIVYIFYINTSCYHIHSDHNKYSINKNKLLSTRQILFLSQPKPISKLQNHITVFKDEPKTKPSPLPIICTHYICTVYINGEKSDFPFKRFSKLHSHLLKITSFLPFSYGSDFVFTSLLPLSLGLSLLDFCVLSDPFTLVVLIGCLTIWDPAQPPA